MAMPTRPRYFAGIISSIAELIAAYSPPIPAPVTKRHMKYHHGAGANAVSVVASRYTASVMRKSLFRPNRSVRRPKINAPVQAPAT